MNKQEGRKGFPPRGKLSAKRTDEGRPCRDCLYTGLCGTRAPHPALRGHLSPPLGEGKKNLTQLHRRVRFMY